MKIDKTAKDKVTKDFDKKFEARVKKTDIIGYEMVDNSTMTGVKYMKEPREPQAPSWFIAFEKKNDQRWERQEAFNAKQETFNAEVREFMVKTDKRLDNLEKDVQVLKEDMIEVKKDIAAIKECPTIKKELKLNKNSK